MAHRLLRPIRILWALLYFLYELVIANARLAWDMVTPGLPTHRAIIRVSTDARTDLEVWLVACAVSMTPGTLTLEADTERNELYIHTLYGEDPEEFVRQIARFERVLLGATR
ncbi:MAG: Na+/H+ antiporter subunit E [Nitriliruptor sp.]